MKIVKGWKNTTPDMTCQGYKFELGEWHEVTGKLEMCKNGFHFHENPGDVFRYYSAGESRLFEIEAADVLTGDDKSCARRIRLVREVIGFEKMLYGYGYGDGSGYGDGYGDGYGYGYGDGDGYGSGDGSGYGDGDGYGYGSGDGSGYGDGDKHIFQRSFRKCI